MTMSNIWIVDLEAVESRYTGQWKTFFPKILKEYFDGCYNINVIDGPNDIPNATTPGAFLNFGGTNIYKSAQMVKIARLFTEGKIQPMDHFIYTDAWNPTILQLKYMSQLLQIPVVIHGLWHAGNYDPNDFLGRLIKDRWVINTEIALAQAIDHNWFATKDHQFMFKANRLFDAPEEDGEAVNTELTGWPMGYLQDLIKPAESKEDIILFPHRISEEKQPRIFKDLATALPQYKFVVCQEYDMTKDEYHSLLSRSKMVFSANLQETLGISCYEALLAGAIPLVPDRLSYTEMYHETFKYPSIWTESWEDYQMHKKELVSQIKLMMEYHSGYADYIESDRDRLTEQYFSCTGLINKLAWYAKR